MENFSIINDKIITSRYTLSLLDLIKKSEDNNDFSEQTKIDLFSEFKNLILQGKITFGYQYCDNEENRLRGRVNKFSGFRTGTQKFKLIPDNKRPKSESEEQTCLRYYDFGRENWRSHKKDLFVVATSFWSETENKWYDAPEKAGFKSKFYNTNGKYKRVDREDTQEEKIKRNKINSNEEEKRNKQILTQIKRTLKKSEDNQFFEIVEGKILLNKF